METRLGRWLRFNDTLVDEFVLHDSALEAECFGGSYKPKPDGRKPVFQDAQTFDFLYVRVLVFS